MNPQLRFPEFTDEWRVKMIGELVDNIGGTALEEFVSGSGSHKFISIGNYTTDGRYIDNGQRINLNSKTSLKLLRKNDLVMVLNDKTSAGDIIGSSILVDEDDTYIYNQRSERLTPKTSMTSKFLWLYLNTSAFRKKIFSISQGGTQIYVNFPSVKKLSLSLPSKQEQEKIADFLTVVDERIEKIEKKLELLQQYKKGVLQKIFTQQIQFKNESGNSYPEWKIDKLGGLADVKTGKKDVNQGNPKGQYPFFTCAREHTYSDSYSFEGEAIMIAGNGEVGLCTYYDGKFEAYQRTYVLQNFSQPAQYLFIYLKEAFQAFAESQKQQGSMPYIKLSTLQDFKVPIQSANEQQKIAGLLTALDDKIKVEQTRLAAARQWKKGLLQRMFV